MRRGRWVAYCIAFILITIHFSLVTPCYGITLGMTATVPLSPQWKEAIRINSDAEIDASRPHILLVSQYTRGIENLPVDKQTIQLLVFKNGKVMEENEKLTNKKGTADFVFVAEQSGTYTLMVINKSDTSPFIVKSATFSL